jgi:S-adenosylmethionine hydrolase
MAGYYGAGDKKQKKPAFLVNSSGLLEIFLYRGNSAKALGVKAGEPVKIFLR